MKIEVKTLTAISTLLDEVENNLYLQLDNVHWLSNGDESNEQILYAQCIEIINELRNYVNEQDPVWGA